MSGSNGRPKVKKNRGIAPYTSKDLEITYTTADSCPECGVDHCVEGTVTGCDDGLVCKKVVGSQWSRCVPCTSNQDCNDGKHCDAGKCVSCKDGACRDGQICQDGHWVKISDCEGGKMCINGKWTSSHDCCSDPGVCLGGKMCKNGKWTQSDECCNNPGVCEGGNMCTNGKWTASRECCDISGECEGGKICKNEKCVPCTSNTECQNGRVCEIGKCVVVETCEDNDCRGGKICENGQWQTVECCENSDCGDGKLCENKICTGFQSTPLISSTPPPNYCRESVCNMLVPKPQTCLKNETCGLCKNDADCPDGKVCFENGICMICDSCCKRKRRGGGDCEQETIRAVEIYQKCMKR